MKGLCSIVHLHEYPIQDIARAIAAAGNTQPNLGTGTAESTHRHKKARH